MAGVYFGNQKRRLQKRVLILRGGFNTQKNLKNVFRSTNYVMHSAAQLKQLCALSATLKFSDQTSDLFILYMTVATSNGI
jgi:hypothetical protein